MSKKTNSLSEFELKSIIPPAGTATWFPVSHGRVIDQIDLAMNNVGTYDIGENNIVSKLRQIKRKKNDR